jgi:hypothetical protein
MRASIGTIVLGATRDGERVRSPPLRERVRAEWEHGLRFQKYKDTKTKKERLPRTDGYPSLAISRINDHERRRGAIFFGRYRPNINS